VLQLDNLKAGRFAMSLRTICCKTPSLLIVTEACFSWMVPRYHRRSSSRNAEHCGKQFGCIILKVLYDQGVPAPLKSS